ncbi:Response regulator receiver [hydrothermal vent metagenome]|jgi:CheY-like chemotaxis protein|uniref:Response regulator receiver n=1 Tax=hydrothermal vent metagenome TaxID=652676 RepID=A0A160TG48_9ZZZZ
MTYKVLVMGDADNGALVGLLGKQYELEHVESVDDCIRQVAADDVKLVLLNIVDNLQPVWLNVCRQLKDTPSVTDTPIVILARDSELDSKMAYYDAGCDDYVNSESMSELQARLMRVIFNKVANDQLKLQLQQANEMAFIAMSDTSDLGVNVQFLLDVNTCDNLDELGMRVFKSLQSYGVNCSLQIRGRHTVKNMEANGMAKEMESVLLQECKDKGRYVDFGRRSIMNYGSVSLLVKNMPMNDDKKYGAIKDNVFSLLQGADARVKALDNLESLAMESLLVKRMAGQMRDLMKHVDSSYKGVMKDIADVVETMADGVESSIQFLGMDERQELALQKIMETGIVDTNRIFNQGMRMDEGLREFLEQVDNVFCSDSVDHAKLDRLLNAMPAIASVH